MCLFSMLSFISLTLDCINNIRLALREQQSAVFLADLEGIGVAAGISAQQEIDGDFALLQKDVELRGDGVLGVVGKHYMKYSVIYWIDELHDAVNACRLAG